MLSSMMVTAALFVALVGSDGSDAVDPPTEGECGEHLTWECVEEAATVVETELRTEPDRKPSGYYADIPSKRSVHRMYSEDVKTLKGKDPKRKITGPEVVDKLNKDFDRLNIGYAEIMGRESAKNAAKKLYGKKPLS